MIASAQAQLIRTVAVTLNSISIAACLAILCIYGFLVIHHPSTSNRITLRLTATLAVVDLFYSVFQILSDVITVDAFLCAFSVWGYVLCTLLGVFLTVALAVNLQLVFLHHAKDTTRYQWLYYSVPVVGAVGCATPAWVMGQYGWEPYGQSCWFRNDGQSDIFALEWATLFAWVLITIVYCLVIVVLVWIKVLQEQKMLQETYVRPVKKRRASNASNRSDTERITSRDKEIEQAVTFRRRKAQMNLTRVVRRVVWYPLVPVITQTPNVGVAIAMYASQQVPFWLLLLSYVGTSMQGVLHFVAFCFDPAVQDAVSKWRHVEPLHEKRVRFDTLDEKSVEPLLQPEMARRPVKRSDTMDSVSRIPLPALAAWRFQTPPMYPEPMYERRDTLASRFTVGSSWETFPSLEEEEDEYWLQASMQIGMEVVQFPPHKTL